LTVFWCTQGFLRGVLEPDTNFMPLGLSLFPFQKFSGLVKRSLLRLDFIMTVPEELISRKIGALPGNLTKEAERKLKRLFGINAS